MPTVRQGCVLLNAADIRRLCAKRPDCHLPDMEVMLRFEVADGNLVDRCIDVAPTPPDDADLFSLATLINDAQVWLQVRLDGWKAVWPPAGLDHEWFAARQHTGRRGQAAEV